MKDVAGRNEIQKESNIMEKGLQSIKRKRRYFQRTAALLLALCISVSGLHVSGSAGTGDIGTAGGKPGAYTDAGNPGRNPSGESQDIVRGFGSTIKDKKQREIKVKVNHGNHGSQNGKSWNLQMIQTGNINAGEAEESGRKIKIVVIDSGINFSTDLPVAVRKNFITEDERNVLYEDPSGHGTAVAGIIAALDNDEGITGINPRVELYSARVLDGNLEAPAGRIAEAIDWAVEQDVDIINMSFGIAKNVKELEEAVERAAAAGILLVAAAGNGETVAYPAAYDEVIAVGSVTAEGLAAEGSAGGEALELMAPGEDILSSGIFGGVMGVSGTSMAAPHIAGAASVLMEWNPDMPGDYIRMLLNYSANLYGSPDEYGNGVIDLGYALEINDKFKKLYEKHIDKAEKNQKKKEKQKEKFWGEVLKTIPENEKAVETFTGVEVVEGMWAGTGHKNLVEYKNQELRLGFTANQMKILVYACNFPDESGIIYKNPWDSIFKNMDVNPYHGFLWARDFDLRIKDSAGNLEAYNYRPLYNSNYIANYLFLTQLAQANGVVEGLSHDNMLENDYNRIYEDFKGGKIGGKNWSEVLAAAGASDTNENRRLFIYGMAIHLVTDVFAHSTWEVNGGTVYSRITHSVGADDTTYHSRRYVAAEEVANKVLQRAYYNQTGSVADFVNAPSAYSGYYIGNFAAYAQMADSGTYNNYKNYFAYGDLWSNVSNEGIIDFEGNAILKAGE